MYLSKLKTNSTNRKNSIYLVVIVSVGTITVDFFFFGTVLATELEIFMSVMLLFYCMNTDKYTQLKRMHLLENET